MLPVPTTAFLFLPLIFDIRKLEYYLLKKYSNL